MPEHGGFKWHDENAAMASPFYNKVIIESRIDTGPFSRLHGWGSGHGRFTWFWFKFRSVYYSKEERRRIWSPEFRVKVMLWGKRGESVLMAKRHDMVHVEGFMTTTKDQAGRYQMGIVAKEAHVRHDVNRRPPQWDALAARNKARSRFGRPVTDEDLRAEERNKLVKRGLIKPSIGDAAFALEKALEEAPEADFSDYDFGV